MGLITLFLVFWLSGQEYAVDSVAKHGISIGSSSRLGGVSIFSALAIYLIIGPIFDTSVMELLNQDSLIYEVGFFSVLIGMIGLADDFIDGISPVFRILALVVVTVFSFALEPSLLP